MNHLLNQSFPFVQAAVILQFKDQPSWPLQALADAMKLTPSALRKTVIFWTSQGTAPKR